MITAVIQARISSGRLPGKVLLPLGNSTVLGSVVKRVGRAAKIGNIIVATSDRLGDDAIEAFCEANGINVFRGDLDDVLDRYYRTAQEFAATDICRVTADCPLIDPAVIDRVATEYERGECEYISTGRVTSTYPDGMDTEIFSFSSLERAWKEAKLISEREHVTPYIWKHPELFRLAEVRSDRDLSALRLTIDEERDYMVLQDIVAHSSDLSMNGIAAYLSAHPEIASINGSIMRDEGYAKSLQEDHEKSLD